MTIPEDNKRQDCLRLGDVIPLLIDSKGEASKTKKNEWRKALEDAWPEGDKAATGQELVNFHAILKDLKEEIGNYKKEVEKSGKK